MLVAGDRARGLITGSQMRLPSLRMSIASSPITACDSALSNMRLQGLAVTLCIPLLWGCADCREPISIAQGFTIDVQLGIRASTSGPQWDCPPEAEAEATLAFLRPNQAVGSEREAQLVWDNRGEQVRINAVGYFEEEVEVGHFLVCAVQEDNASAARCLYAHISGGEVVQVDVGAVGDSRYISGHTVGVDVDLPVFEVFP